MPQRGQWQVMYLGFARHGWTDAAQQYADDIGNLTEHEDTNWQSVGARLLDLSQVDRDLHQWSRNL